MSKESSCAWGLSTDLWQLVAKCTVRVHRFRTVYHVVEDLVSTQLVCKASTDCAQSLWQNVAELCAERYRLRTDAVRQLKVQAHRGCISAALQEDQLQKAIDLSDEKHTVFMQLQSERYEPMPWPLVASKYRLTEQDWQFLTSLPKTFTFLGKLRLNQACFHLSFALHFKATQHEC